MNIPALEKTALSVRALSMDAIQKANSGHPGLPLGAAEFGALLYGELLRHDPSEPLWAGRDRFILSAGHGSMLLYSLLCLAGYKDFNLENIKSFRQPGSSAAGHPEHGFTGVEATSGPLGQGIAMAVGFAAAETMLAARFNTTAYKIVDHYTYVLCGDGCMMEGISAEASSFAGRHGLGKLIVYYDSNRTTIDGSTDLTFTEDIAKRYEAQGWQTLHGSMYDFEEIARLNALAKAETQKPSLIILSSIIGKGAPNKQNTADTHGAPLGKDEVAAAKAALGIPCDFYIAPEALEYFTKKKTDWKKARMDWDSLFEAWSKENPEKRKEWDAFHSMKNADMSGTTVQPVFNAGDSIATRAAGAKALAKIASVNKNLTGGSADLKGPNAVSLPAEFGIWSPENRAGSYIYFGIREFAMAAICNGISLHGGLRAYCSTFTVFADYLRPALRMSALMKQPVIYVFTHDSFYVGEDGPTHQPVEHIVSMRIIPGLLVLRPGDAEETIEAWNMAIENTLGPTALIFSRQNIKVFSKDDPDWKNTIRTGAYIVKTNGAPQAPDEQIVIIATGSEVNLALEAAALAEAKKPNLKIRVVSMLCKELFESQPDLIRNAIIPEGSRVIVCEAGVRSGWERWAKPQDILSIDRFGVCGPPEKVAECLGFTAGALADIILQNSTSRAPCGHCQD